jgi:hypothetical protein
MPWSVMVTGICPMLYPSFHDFQDQIKHFPPGFHMGVCQVETSHVFPKRMTPFSMGKRPGKVTLDSIAAVYFPHLGWEDGAQKPMA